MNAGSPTGAVGPAAIRHLLVDYGEVITTAQPEEDLARMAELADLDVPTLVERYWFHRGDYDVGCTAAVYWSRVLERPVADADPVLAGLVGADMDSWCHLDQRVLDVLARAADSGMRLTLLSNAPHELARVVRRMPAITDLFGELVFSAELGAAKPDPVVFRTALARTGMSAHETLFIDDRERNVAPAAQLGLHTLRFTTYGEFADTIGNLIT